MIRTSSAGQIHYNNIHNAIELSGFFVEHTELKEEGYLGAGRGI